MINESLIKGKDIYLFRYYRAGSTMTYESLGLATSHTISIKYNTIDVASDSDIYVSNKKLQSISYTISIDCLYVNTDFYDIMTIANEGTSLAIFIGELNSEITEYPYKNLRSPLNDKKFGFSGIITSLEMNAPSDNIVTYKVTISGASDILM